MAMTNGPNNAKPSANAALVVRAKRPLAARSCPLGTRKGIIEASAGPKKVVTVETRIISRYSKSRLPLTRKTSTKAAPRSGFRAGLPGQWQPALAVPADDPGLDRDDLLWPGRGFDDSLPGPQRAAPGGQWPLRPDDQRGVCAGLRVVRTVRHRHRRPTDTDPDSCRALL